MGNRGRENKHYSLSTCGLMSYVYRKKKIQIKDMQNATILCKVHVAISKTSRDVFWQSKWLHRNSYYQTLF